MTSLHQKPDESELDTFFSNLEFQIKHRFRKRVFDILFSLSILVLFIPVFIIVAIAIRISSKGPVVYAHQRVGRGGKKFGCYKFRTMYPDADKKLKEILETNPDLKKEWETSYKLKNDPRVTPIGSFLRKTSLDEFPQFINVLKGDLSVVGPRPVIRDEIVKYYGEKASKVLSIRPGLTGLWQVSGRSNTTYDSRVLLDEEYINNQSLVLDIKLVLKTIPAMISSRGAY
jgi:undecaprenyl-phosphate galactose phosphotransferase